MMNETLPSILSILDEGIALYRRNFVGFTLITAVCLAPTAIFVGLLSAAAALLSGAAGVLLALGGGLLLFPLTIYLLGGLSRAALAAIEGRPVRLSQALAIAPLRAAGMGCFAIVYIVAAQIAIGMLALLCICPIIFGGGALLGSAGALIDRPGDTFGAALVVAFILFLGLYIMLLAISGVAYSSLMYALQPWVQESRSFGATLQRSFDLLGYRFRRNLLAWVLAGLLLSAIGLVITTTIGSLLPLPLTFALGERSIAARAISATAWLLGLVVVLPPLPIWMTLLYRRNVAARDGADLQQAVQSWRQEHTGAPADGNNV